MSECSLITTYRETEAVTYPECFEIWAIFQLEYLKEWASLSRTES
jgi:hypothetical protein